MKFLKWMQTFAVCTLMVSAGAAAHAQHVTTDYDHNTNFESYHTFSFYKVHTANPLFEQRVRDEISRDLQAKGWQQVDSGGDIAITAIGFMRNKQEYNTFYDDLGPGFGWRGWGGWWGRGWIGDGGGMATTTVQEIPVGTLVVDLYDNHTHNLIFRGTASGEASSKSEKNVGKVNKAIDKIFDHFPPHAH